jgi:hypothetical protein
MKGLEQKKELILQRELLFANEIGSIVFEKPKVSFWMILIPILFLYFVYRMQKFKNGRLKFNEEFMVSRRRAMEIAFESVKTRSKPNIDQAVREIGLSDALEKPYASWLRVLVDYYTDILSAEGDSLESLTRSAYRGKTEYLLNLNRINSVEKEFYAALKPRMADTEGADEIIAIIQRESQRLRRDLADSMYA